MPFTPSHAVVALPFVRTPLAPGAIAVGAMTPDLALFTRGVPLPYGVTHDLRALPGTILLALVLLVLWRTLLRPAARELSPRWLAARLPEHWDAGARAGMREIFGRGAAALALTLASLAVGVLSHIVWDLFTHEGRLGVGLFPALAESWGPQPGYGWLQDASSVLGLAVLAVAGGVWLRRRGPVMPARRLPPAVRWAWWISLPVALITAWAWGLAAFGPLRPGFGAAHLAYRMLPPACAIWALVTLVLAVAVRLAPARR